MFIPKVFDVCLFFGEKDLQLTVCGKDSPARSSTGFGLQKPSSEQRNFVAFRFNGAGYPKSAALLAICSWFVYVFALRTVRPVLLEKVLLGCGKAGMLG